MKKTVLVVAPHPDDEILGVGGTIHRLTKAGASVIVAIVTKGWEPLFPADQVTQVREEARQANASLGVRDLRFLDLPVTRLGELPAHELNGAFEELVEDVSPSQVYLPYRWDRHSDHGHVFDAAIVALRPTSGRSFVEQIYCYETVSETHWTAPGQEPSFDPNVWVDISGEHLDAKTRAMSLYASQVRPSPDARSLEAIKGLATWRGSVVGLAAAEAFLLVRDVQRRSSSL